MKDMVKLLLAAKPEEIGLQMAKDAWLEFRLKNGKTSTAPLLTAEDGNMKFMKSGKKFDFVTFGLSLAPAKQSGEFNVCRYATGCAAICVAHSGNGRYDKVVVARVLKTKFLAANPNAFVTLLADEIGKAVVKHKHIAVRLNTFSDITWETCVPWLFERWTKDEVAFYDYTKWPEAQRAEAPGYDLTRSATELQTDEQIVAMLEAGSRVAVCLDLPKKDEVPATWKSFPVVDGDKHDARFVEDKGVVVLLRPKGSARRGGFVRPLESVS